MKSVTVSVVEIADQNPDSKRAIEIHEYPAGDIPIMRIPDGTPGQVSERCFEDDF